MADRRIRQAFFMAVTVGWLVAIPGVRAGFGLPICPAAQIVCGGTVLGSCKVAPGTVLNCALPPGSCVLTTNANAIRLHMNNMVVACVAPAMTGVCMTGTLDMLAGPGTVANCATGISATGIDDVAVHVTAASNTTGFSATGFADKITNSQVIANGVGIKLSGAHEAAATNVVTLNTGNGIELLGPGTPVTGAINNVVSLNAGDGIFDNGTGGQIWKNSVSANNIGGATGAGIELGAASSGVNVHANSGVNNSTGGGDTWNFEDDTGACVANTWPGNNTEVPAATSSPACAF